jgi:two-component system sensor histidine kinase/response regulator
MPQSDIMIVDDNPANLKLLEDMLLQKGHKVRSFPLGRLALEAAKKHPPDLILLDVNMPEMNGYEVCERLKSIKELASIPVIFLSALDESEDKVKAFQGGAADYVSKPFRFEEVHARVETHLKLHALGQALQSQNERLEEAVAARTRELSIANERLTILDHSKNDFLTLISHEFRTPLNGVLGAGELILGRMPPTEQNNELKDIYRRSRQRILTILDDALLLTQIDVSGERFKSAEVSSLSPTVGQALEQTAEFAKARHVTLMPPPLDMGSVAGNEDLLVRALQALIETAVKFSAEGEAILLSSEAAPGLAKGYRRGQRQNHSQPCIGEVFRSVLDRRSHYSGWRFRAECSLGISHSFVVRRLGQCGESGTGGNTIDDLAEGCEFAGTRVESGVKRHTTTNSETELEA